MVSLARGTAGLLSLGAVVGIGIGVSYLSSDSKRGVSLSSNFRWLNTEDDTDKEEWQKKVSTYVNNTDGLENYLPDTDQDANISQMKKVCKELRESVFESFVLESKLKQAKSWCSISK